MSGRPSFLAVAVLAIPAVAVAWFSTEPRYPFRGAERSALVVSFKHTSQRVRECTDEERKRFLERLRNLKHGENVAAQCGSRERLPVNLVISLDRREMVRKTIQPSGWRRDSAVYVMEKLALPPGLHRVVVAMGEGEEGEDLKYRYEETINFPPGGIVGIEFEGAHFYFRQSGGDGSAGKIIH